MIVNGKLDLSDCKNLKSLGKLKKVRNNLYCPNNLENLGDLEYVGEYLNLYCCTKLKSLGKLKEVKGYLSCPRNIKDLSDLEYVNGSLYLSNCKNLKSLGKLKEIKSNIYLNRSGIIRECVKENHPHLLNKCNWSF